MSKIKDPNGDKFDYLLDKFTLEDVNNYHQKGFEVLDEHEFVASIVTDGKYMQFRTEKRD